MIRMDENRRLIRNREMFRRFRTGEIRLPIRKTCEGYLKRLRPSRKGLQNNDSCTRAPEFEVAAPNAI